MHSASSLELASLALQTFNVLFLFLHDWVPLGRLNNLSAVKAEDTLQHRVWVTLLGGVPAAVCLVYSVRYYGRAYPHGVALWLWMTYGLLLMGLLRAWWIPYLIMPDRQRAARYARLFVGTSRFLPLRHGMAPDTLHTLFHASVVLTLITLLARHSS